jgi:hypothetical protein
MRGLGSSDYQALFWKLSVLSSHISTESHATKQQHGSTSPSQLDLSTLRSDGTGRGPQGDDKVTYVQVTNLDQRYLDFLRTLTTKFNNNAGLVGRHRQYLSRSCTLTALLTMRTDRHEFIGDLPRGCTLWTHPPRGQIPVLEVYGDPRDGHYRSATRFTIHVGELLTANDAADAPIRAAVHENNTFAAFHAILDWNKWVDYYIENYGIFYDYRNPNIMAHAGDLQWLRRYANQEIHADKQRDPTIAFNCNCVFR